MKIKYGRPVEELHLSRRHAGIKFALGENPKRSNNPSHSRHPASLSRDPRMGVEEVIRDAFTRARDYKKTWDEYNARSQARRQESDSATARSRSSSRFGRRCSRASATFTRTVIALTKFMMLINIANEFGFKVKTFQHVLEGYKVAKEIAQHGAGGSTFRRLLGL